MDKKKQLEKEVRAFSNKCQIGDTISMYYDGDCVATYTFTERTLDSKTPLHWLRGCLCFEISFKDRDINKVELREDFTMSDKRKELEKEVNTFSNKCQKGDTISMYYDGSCTATYTFTERALDSKTPLQWLRELMCFDIDLRGRSIDKVELRAVYG